MARGVHVIQHTPVTGLVGLLMLCAFLVLIAREIFATRHAWLVGVTLYCVIQGMVNPIFFTPVLAMFAVTLALTYAGLKKSAAGDSSERVAQ